MMLGKRPLEAGENLQLVPLDIDLDDVNLGEAIDLCHIVPSAYIYSYRPRAHCFLQ